MLVVFLIVALMAGVSVLRRGLRGRVIDDHPWCVACGFDLVGQPADQHRCPECGAVLYKVGAVGRGRRARRPRLIGWGAALVLLAVMALSALVVGNRWQVNWQRYKPAFWLEEELKYGSNGARYAAGSELVDRVGAGSVSPTQIDQVMRTLMRDVEQRRPASWQGAELLERLMASGKLTPANRQAVLRWVLDVQLDPSKPFPSALGGMAHAAFLNGEISDAEFGVFLSHICAPKLQLAHGGPLAPGEEVPIYIQWNWRGGGGPFQFGIEVPGTEAAASSMMRHGGWFGGPPGLGLDESRLLIAPTQVGPHTLTGTISLSMGREYFARGLSAAYPLLAGAKRDLSTLPDLTTEFPLSLSYEVDPALDNPQARLRNRVASMFWTSEALELGFERVNIPLFARSFAASMQVKFEARWTYAGREVRLGGGVLTFSPTGSTSTFEEAGGSSSHFGSSGSGRTGDVWEQVNLRAPIGNGGPAEGRLVLVIQELTVDDAAAGAAQFPMSIELPAIRVAR